jgi:hypothetical protein
MAVADCGRDPKMGRYVGMGGVVVGVGGRDVRAREYDDEVGR